MDENYKIVVSATNEEFINKVSAITNYTKGENIININPEDLTRTVITYKNEEIKLKIIKETKDEFKKQQPRVANKEVTEYIAKRLSKDLSTQVFNRATRKRQTDYITGSLVENTSITPECREDRVVRSIVLEGGRKLVTV